MTFSYEIMWIVVSFLLTLMVLSYLLGDNIFFRFASHLFIGAMAGYVVLLISTQILWPYLIRPIVNGTLPEALWLGIPLVLIFMLVLSQFKRFTWIGSLPLAYMAGLAAAIAVGGAVFGTLLPQSRAIVDSFDSAMWYAVPNQTWLRILDAVLMLVGTVATLSYFHFGRKRKSLIEEESEKRPAILEGLSKVGQVFIGISLGAVFAGVFSSSLLALIDRILFIGQFFTNLFRSF
ncbi:MAG TPA: hypothetical protein VIM80_00520 [Brevefilum sp.]